MPPTIVIPAIEAARASIAKSAENTASFFGGERTSWRSPDDILTILMLIGGDIIQRAIAQLAGSGPGPFAPVAFSFGWLSYAVAALMSAVGDGKLMPQPECDSILVNVKSGYQRNNRSWILGRLLRDHEKGRKKGTALTVAFYYVTKVGKPAKDWVYWCGVVTILVQLGIAGIPGVLHGDWLVLTVTGGGTILALVESGLKQWREEKYCARPLKGDKPRDVVCVTRGNGSPYAMILISEGQDCLRLEDLAGGREKDSLLTSFATAGLGVLWIVLLLTVEGLDGDAWYMLAIGGLGMVQNVLAAGARRGAAALGFHVKESGEGDYIAGETVMTALKKAEEQEAGVGIVLVDIFFPGGVREDEKKYWEEKKESREDREHEAEEKRESVRQSSDSELKAASPLQKRSGL